MKGATRMISRLTVIAMASFLTVLVACSSGSPSGSSDGTSSPSGDPSKDKLAQVLARGTLVLFTDPAYPPQSFAVNGAQRAANTKCTSNEMTALEISGYDADTGKLVAQALGVEPCFVAPTWTEVTGGNWGDRWDLAYGSGAIDLDRMDRLYMTQPYYATPADFFVPKDSTVHQSSELSGMTVGACAGCTMEEYLRGTLQLPGPGMTFVVNDPQIVTYTTEPPGLKATAKGKLDAFLCSEPVGAEAIKNGLGLRMLESPAYVSYKTGYVDQNSGLSAAAFVDVVNEIILDLHADGELAALSKKYFGKDYATLASTFDIDSVGQTVT